MVNFPGWRVRWYKRMLEALRQVDHTRSSMVRKPHFSPIIVILITLPLWKFHWKSTCLLRRPFVRYWDSGCVGWDFSKWHVPQWELWRDWTKLTFGGWGLVLSFAVLCRTVPCTYRLCAGQPGGAWPWTQLQKFREL